MTRTVIMKRYTPVAIQTEDDLRHSITKIGSAGDIPAEKARCIAAATRLGLVAVLPERWRPDLSKGTSFQKALNVEEGSAVAPPAWDRVRALTHDALTAGAQDLAKATGVTFERAYTQLLEACPTAAAALR